MRALITMSCGTTQGVLHKVSYGDTLTLRVGAKLACYAQEPIAIKTAHEGFKILPTSTHFKIQFSFLILLWPLPLPIKSQLSQCILYCKV